MRDDDLESRIGWTLDACVKTGPLATVYRATRAGEQAALKIYRPDLHGREAERIVRERAALEAITHPNVARLRDGGVLPDGSIYLASEWVQGKTLEERFREGPMPWAELREVAMALAQGLHAVHQAGIVHRDVKPSNVMVEAGRRTVLLDLGHAIVLGAERLTDRGWILGSASHMAPEQAQGAELDGRADLYALGVVLYQGLCGQLPFDDESPAEVMRKHQFEPVVPPRRHAPGLPAAVEDLCLWLLAKDPALRVPNTHVLAVTLRALEQQPQRFWREERVP